MSLSQNCPLTTDKKQIYRDSFSLPLGNLFSLKNYEMLFERYDIARAYMHSIIISGTVTIAVMLSV